MNRNARSALPGGLCVALIGWPGCRLCVGGSRLRGVAFEDGEAGFFLERTFPWARRRKWVMAGEML